MKALTFNLELLQPLLVTQLGGGDENSAVSLNYIPGSVLRNALAARYIASNQLGDAAATDSACRALFFDGQVWVLNALPADWQGRRSLPTPLSWYAEKERLGEWNEDREKTLTFYDAAVDREILQEMKDAKPLARTDPFCCRDDEVEFVKVEKQVSVHIFREHKRQFTTKNDSQVFSYQALAPGQLFCSAILSTDETLLEQMAGLLGQSPELSIGGSRSAGYGLVRFTDIRLAPDWHEYSPGDDNGAAGEDVMIITLLSDVIARDPNGQFCNNIGPLLGITQKPQPCFRLFKTVGGFNRKWGLPLPQAQAIQAGSVFIYPAGAVNEAMLQQALKEGIGEYRQDGFGRIAVNRQTDRELTAQQPRRDKTQITAYTLDQSARRVAQRLVEHQLRWQLDQAVQNAIARLELSGNSSNAVLSRLRLVARQAAAQHNMQPVRDFLRNIEGKHAGESLQNVHLDGNTFWAWLKKHVDRPNIEHLLQLNLKNALSFNDVWAELTEALQDEYTARLIEGIARRKVKQNKEKEAQA